MPSATYSQYHISVSEQKSDFLHMGDWIGENLPAIHHENYAEVSEWIQDELYDLEQTPKTPIYPDNYHTHHNAQSVTEHHSQHQKSDTVTERSFDTQSAIWSWKQGPETIFREVKSPKIIVPSHNLTSQKVERRKQVTTSSAALSHDMGHRNPTNTSLYNSLNCSPSTMHYSTFSQTSHDHSRDSNASLSQDKVSSSDSRSQIQAELYARGYDSNQSIPVHNSALRTAVCQITEWELDWVRG